MIRIRRRPLKKNATESKAQQKSSSKDIPLSKSLEENIQYFSSLYQDSTDVMFHSFIVGEKDATIVYIEGLSDTQKLDEQVLEILMDENEFDNADFLSSVKNRLPISNIKKIPTYSACINAISNGNPVLFFDGFEEAFSLGLVKFEKRSIEEPAAETSIRGPREGFTESLSVNTSLLRRIIKDPALKMKSVQVGKYTKTKVIVSYIEGLVDPTLIKEIENRLNRIKIDGVLESGYIEQFIEDDPYSPFPQVLYTERPDVVCANLLEGRAVLLIEGTPFSLIAPVSFFSLFQSQEDYYERFWIGTFIRSLRFLFLAVALFLPSVYVAITTFHQEMVPTDLLLSIASSRETVPFPAIVEAIMMEIAFEALREAGIRLPKQVGSAVSIVGALVIGQAAVQAGIVSAPMIIVVSITGIASFMVPRYSVGLSIRLLRFPIIILAGALGLIGVMLALIMLIIHLSTLRSFGIPYLSPVNTLQKHFMQDTLIRSPLWKMNSRPHFTGDFNETRQGTNLKPGTNKSKD
ncbi:spore germination protein [Mesobacillus maritimus]|uniref:spore germination protein n=1 Tax=Mesobacillus maritimus TaxID=1643336 RepID=UPI00203EA6FB|nr:spore germination protein [Mesobacillus maritimus]MCM3672023.1 spore germination protein [Mesobacillus maritimus]